MILFGKLIIILKKDDNKNKLSSQVFSCSSLSGREKIYEVKDMNFNTYIFTEESIMKYKVEFTLK